MYRIVSLYADNAGINGRKAQPQNNQNVNILPKYLVALIAILSLNLFITSYGDDTWFDSILQAFHL